MGRNGGVGVGCIVLARKSMIRLINTDCFYNFLEVYKFLVREKLALPGSTTTSHCSSKKRRCGDLEI